MLTFLLVFVVGLVLGMAYRSIRYGFFKLDVRITRADLEIELARRKLELQRVNNQISAEITKGIAQ